MVRELLKRCAEPSQQDNVRVCGWVAGVPGITAREGMDAQDIELVVDYLMEGCNALHWAAHQGHLGVVRVLLAHSPLLNSIPNRAGRTAQQLLPADTADEHRSPSHHGPTHPTHPSPTHPAPSSSPPWTNPQSPGQLHAGPPTGQHRTPPAPPTGIPRLSPAKGPVMPHVAVRPTSPRHEPACVQQQQYQQQQYQYQQHQQHQQHQYQQQQYQQQQQQHESPHMCPSPRHEPAHVRQQQQYHLQQQQLPHLQPASQWGYAANAVEGPGSSTPGTSSPDSARLLSHYPNVTSKFDLLPGTGLASPASNPFPLASCGASPVALGPPSNPHPYDQPHRATTAPAPTDAYSPFQSQPEGLPPWLSLPCAPHTPTQQPQAGFRAVQPMAGLLAEMPKMGAGTGGEQGDVQGPGSSPWQQQIPRQQRQQQQQQPPPPPPSHQQQLPHQAQVESQPLQTSESLSNCLTVGNNYTLEQLEEATNNFSNANRLGKGGFALVYYGYLQQLHVAVKKPATRIDPEGIHHFKTECKVLSTINHPNIIPLVGTCPEEVVARDHSLSTGQAPHMPGWEEEAGGQAGREGILVYQLARLGSLDDNLFRTDQGPGASTLPLAGSSAGGASPSTAPAANSHRPLDWKQCIKAGGLRVVWHVARGLMFLHSMRVVHRDIKAGAPQNILLSEDREGPVGMLGDVGLAKLVQDIKYGSDPSRLVGGGEAWKRGKVCTCGYVPPECLHEVTGKWDIYSLGESHITPSLPSGHLAAFNTPHVFGRPGIVLLQLVSRDRLLRGSQLRKAMLAAYKADAAIFNQAIDPRWADALDAAKQLTALALQCTEKDYQQAAESEMQRLFPVPLREAPPAVPESLMVFVEEQNAGAAEDDAAVQPSDLHAALQALPAGKPLPSMSLPMEDSPLVTEPAAVLNIASMTAEELMNAALQLLASTRSAHAAMKPAVAKAGPALRKRGRPLGSKNKPKPAAIGPASATPQRRQVRLRITSSSANSDSSDLNSTDNVSSGSSSSSSSEGEAGQAGAKAGAAGQARAATRVATVPRESPAPSPAQPSPAQPSPAQPSPAQPSPAQPSPAQPSPAQPSPAQPSPAQPSPAQPSPAQPSPAQPSPAQPSPAQPSPAQPSPAQPSPAQPSPAQPSPAQPSPAQPSPAQPSPAQPSPAQPSPAQPSPAQPSPAQPSPAQPSPAQPSPAQPSPAQPSPAQPSPAQPSPAQPSPAQPSPAQPSPAQPSPAQPSPK
ncbi:hypothetical protein QJQ45_007138 [Haematococcus lacustris]|nr:hypothetical protein QJQ45_007138 [Haematococcus lacustris]